MCGGEKSQYLQPMTIKPFTMTTIHNFADERHDRERHGGASILRLEISSERVESRVEGKGECKWKREAKRRDLVESREQKESSNEGGESIVEVEERSGGS